MSGFRIAHVSDLHVLALDGAVPFRLFNKRLTGYANIRFRRGHTHKTPVLEAVLRDLREHASGPGAIDHVAVTGDLTNLALQSEFARAGEILQNALGLGPERISIVPGNHDFYTRGAARSRRFSGFFAPYLASDLNEHPTEAGFPFVKVRGPVALIGLSTAVPRAPFIASGKLGREQLGALDRVLAHPEVRKRAKVLLAHHPLINPPSAWKTFTGGLEDARELAARLDDLERGLVLHGHLHARMWRRLPTRGGVLDVLGATSGSLVHAHPDRMAGYNVYELDGDGTLLSASARVFDPGTEGFVSRPLPEPR